MTADQPAAECANPIEILFDALARGNISAARAVLTPNARIWHGFDQVALTVEDLLGQWTALIGGTHARYLADVRHQPTGDGYVQQHLL